jgi:hypothetical protein
VGKPKKRRQFEDLHIDWRTILKMDLTEIVWDGVD